MGLDLSEQLRSHLMVFRLKPSRPHKQLPHPFPAAQCRLDVQLIHPVQAGLKAAVRGQAQPIAARAKSITDGMDQPERTGSSLKGPVFRRTVARQMAPWLHAEPKLCRDLHDASERQVRCMPLLVGVSDRHVLDEPHMQRMIYGQTQKILDLILVDSLEQDAVQLDGPKTGLGSSLDAGHYRIQASAPGDEGESGPHPACPS